MRPLIVDDDETERLMMVRALGRVGVTAFALTERLDSLDSLAAEFERAGADVAIVDHKLREANFAPFLGAEAVADLSGRGMPGMLVTRHGAADVSSIRRCAKDIPSYLRRDEFAGRPEVLVEGAARAVDVVMNGVRPADTALRSTVVHVADTGQDALGTWILAEINAWSRESSIRLILDETAPQLLEQGRPRIIPGTNLVGYVNTSAQHPEMLVVERLEFALTQPDGDGGLTVPGQ